MTWIEKISRRKFLCQEKVAAWVHSYTWSNCKTSGEIRTLSTAVIIVIQINQYFNEAAHKKHQGCFLLDIVPISLCFIKIIEQTKINAWGWFFFCKKKTCLCQVFFFCPTSSCIRRLQLHHPFSIGFLVSSKRLT